MPFLRFVTHFNGWTLSDQDTCFQRHLGSGLTIMIESCEATSKLGEPIMRHNILCAVALLAMTAAGRCGAARVFASPPAKPPAPADDPVLRQEAGNWKTTCTLRPTGFGGPTESYFGTESDVLAVDRTSLSRSYESKELFNHLLRPEMGKNSREAAFKWATWDGARLRYDRNVHKYICEWHGSDVAKRNGWMEGSYDSKRNVLTMKYINPSSSSAENGRISRTIHYIDHLTKKTVVSIEYPENRNKQMSTSFVVLEIVAKKTSE
jgi:hypothetical protein